MTISCTGILREGAGPKYRYPLSARRRPERPRSELRGGDALRLGPEAPELVAEKVQRHGSRDGQRLCRDLGHTGGFHEQREENEAEAERHETHEDEAHRLKAGPATSGV